MVIEILYPEICNMYGDYSNVIYLEKCFPKATIIRTELQDEPYFINHDTDMIYIGSMPEIHQERLIGILKPHKMRLWKLIEAGTVLLATGNAGDLFGRYIECNGSQLAAIGLFDYHVLQDKERRDNSRFVGQYEDIKVVGYRSTFSYPQGNIPDPLFTIIRGKGNNGSDREEGIKYRNCLITYVIGPILPMNPLFMKKIMAMLKHDGEPAFEKEAMEAYEYNLAQMMQPGAKIDLGSHGV